METFVHACESYAIKTRLIFVIASDVTEPNDNQTKEQCIWRCFFCLSKLLSDVYAQENKKHESSFDSIKASFEKS